MANKYNELQEAYASLTVADDDSTSLQHAQTSWGGVTTVQVNIHQIGITTSSSMTTFVNLERGLPTTILELFPLVFCARAS